MALELVRKFIDGAFRYVTEEEAGGGGGGSQPIQLLGPFLVDFETPDIADGALLTLLAAGTIVIDVRVFTNVAWAGDDPPNLAVVLGNLDYGPPDDDWGTISEFPVSLANSGTGYQLATWPGLGAPDTAMVGGGRLTADGALAAYVGETGLTAGESEVYALVYIP